MQLVPYKAIDWYVDDPLEIIEVPDNIAKLIEKRGVGISAYTDEGCMGCGGLILWDEYVAEAWVRISRKGFKYRKEGIRAIKEAFTIITNTGKDMCIFCWVNTEWPEAQRLVKWLGFVKQGEEYRVIDKKTYGLWEFDNGNHLNDCRSGDVSRRADTAR